MPPRDLGPIARLQIQRDPLKQRGSGYDPGPLLVVDEAALGPGGMVGRHDDAWVIDAHHRDHPRVRGRGNRALSIGFTGHYTAMAHRFGEVEIGCGGENIVVEHDGRITEADLAGEVVVHTPDVDVVLRDARVAAPCAEFTSWIKGLDVVVPKQDQAEDVAFLDEGTRGFILAVDHLDSPVTLRVGDRVSIWSE